MAQNTRQLGGEPRIFSGDTSVVDTTQQYPLGMRARDNMGYEYVYLAGCSSTIAGSWVTYDEAGATTLLAANAIGPVAVAMAATDSTSEYGWYCIWGVCEGDFSANVSADVVIGYESTAGHCGDGHAAGDNMRGAVIRDAVTTAGLATVQLNYPYVDDDSN